jgi:hypothetical protein
MDESQFTKWLKEKYSKRTIQSRLSNCRRVEEFEGDLDSHFTKDEGISLVKCLIYSADDKRNNRKARHAIPINGDIYDGTATLKQAAKLYFRFKSGGAPIKKATDPFNPKKNKIILPKDKKEGDPIPKRYKIDIESFPEILNEENHFVEFKTSALWSKNYTSQNIQNNPSDDVKKYRQDTSKFIIAKTIASFQNADGGNLIIGVKEIKNLEKNEIIGIKSEFLKLGDRDKDGYRRMIIEDIIKKFFPPKILNHINNNLEINFREIEGKLLCHILIHPSDSEVFIKFGKEKYFFIRTDASSRELKAEELLNYCKNRF